MSALTGTKVIEIASDATAFAGKLLADMGAEVVLVEPPGGAAARGYPPFVDDEPGPERSLHWWHFHTSKRGVTLDLEGEEGRALLGKLLAEADVLLEAESAERLSGLGHPTYDRLVHAAISPFGRDSKRTDEPVTDLTIIAGGGPAWSCGYDDHSLPPIRGGGFQGYAMAGHYAVLSILTALLYRHASGRGQLIDVSQHAAANVTTESASYHWLVQQGTVERQTGRHAFEHMTMPSQIRCADGRYVCTGVPPRTPREFENLLQWMDEVGIKEDFPETPFLEMGAQKEHIDLGLIGTDDETTAIFSSAREAMNFIASRLSAVDFFRGAQTAGLATGVIYSPEEAYEDEHFVARGFQQELRHDDLDRAIRYPGAPYRFEKSPWALHRRAPRLGEHNEEVFGSLGMTSAELSTLREHGVI